MPCIFSFHYNKILIFAFVYWILEITLRMLIHYKSKYFQFAKPNAYNEYIFVILQIIGDLCAGFLVLYIYISLKKSKDLNIDENNENNLIMDINSDSINNKRKKSKSSEHRSKNFKTNIVIVVFLYTSCKLVFFIFYQSFKDATYTNVSHKFQKDVINHTDILARFIFSIYFLKEQALKHYKFAILIIFFGILILIPIDIISMYINEKINKSLTLIYVAILLFRAIFFPLADIKVKSILKNDYIMPENLLFFIGIGEFIYLIIITPILFFTLDVKDNFVFNPYNHHIAAVITIFIIYTISSCVKEVLIMKVIYYFSSQSVSFLILSESITGSIYYIIDAIKSNKELESILSFAEIIVILIATFATLIFDEIIIIHKCGLDKDAEREIALRAEDDINYLTQQNLSIHDEEKKEEEREEENNLITND